MPELDLRVTGVGVGHWTDIEASTGCTVVVFPDGTVASGEVRGGAPATREFALLDPLRTVASIDAVVLSGGSAFGLAAADGVMSVLEAAGRGFETTGGRVPIVVGMSLYDLAQGRADVRPGAAEGATAAERALANVDRLVATGRIGAGTGATVGKWRGPDHVRQGGLGGWVVRRDELVVAALVAVNSVGVIDDPDVVAAILADRWDGWPSPDGSGPLGSSEATTIGVVLTNATLDKTACQLVAQSGHNGLARALLPAHTRADGDAMVAAATGAVEAPVDVVRLLATMAVEQAIRSAAGSNLDQP